MRSGAAAAAGRVHVPLPGGAPTDYERDMSRLATAQFVTASCFVRRDVLEAIGGFDERFTSAWREDSDLQFRLLGAQGGVVDASWAVVEHPVRPAKWAASLSRHRKILFDALLFKKHPRLYRERIRSTAPWHYHAIVIALVAIAAGALLRSPALAWTGFGVWLALTAEFAFKRLHGTSHAPAHVADMIVTSIAIPPLAVFWRLVGAFRFRVFFL
jgi:GT2 family glycosyltransferase